MTKALFLAKKSLYINEIPVGAILIHRNKKISSSFNIKKKF
jgi:hypothetical protein